MEEAIDERTLDSVGARYRRGALAGRRGTENDGATDRAIYVGTTTGRTFYKLNSNNGKLIWKIAGTDALPTSAALGADGIVYVSMGATVLALHPDGSELWRHTTGDYINSSPAIGADRTLYIGSSDHHLYAFGP